MPRPKQLKSLTGKVVKHGTLHAYQMYECRCTRCKRAQTDYRRKWRAELRAKNK